MRRAYTSTRVSPERRVVHVAGYLRVSTEDQARSGLGLADQRRRVLGMAEAKGWPEPVLFTDEGISGTKDASGRPALAQLLAEVAAGRVDAVIVLSLDRLGRKTSIVLNLVEDFSQRGVALISCKEQLDTSTPQGQFVLTMFAALAQLERDLIAERTRAALAEHDLRDGEKGGRLPYGYLRSSNDIRVNREEAVIVRRIFDLRRRGFSLRKIAERMRDTGVPGPRGGKWHHTSIVEILDNRAAYLGGCRGSSAVHWPAILGKKAAAVTTAVNDEDNELSA